MKSFYLCALAICLNIQSAAEESKEVVVQNESSTFEALRRSWQLDEVKRLFNQNNVNEADPKTGKFPIIIAAESVRPTKRIHQTITHPDGMDWDLWEKFIPDYSMNCLAYLITLQPHSEQCALAAEKLAETLNINVTPDPIVEAIQKLNRALTINDLENFPEDKVDQASFDRAKKLYEQLKERAKESCTPV